MNGPAVQIDNLSKTFPRGRRVLHVAALSVAAGEMVALIGPSGSGKSTLLRHIAGLTFADRHGGTVTVHGRTVQAGGRPARQIRSIRGGIGMVFQQFNLVGRLPVMTNVLLGALSRLPLWRTLPGWFPTREQDRARRALARVGIGELAFQRASTLSGGQQQRAAIARTLVQGARVILADEPIASLDPESTRRVMETLQDLNRSDGITVLVSLHQVDVAVRYCRRVVALRGGTIVFDGPADQVTDAVLTEVYGSELPMVHETAPQPEPSFA